MSPNINSRKTTSKYRPIPLESSVSLEAALNGSSKRMAIARELFSTYPRSRLIALALCDYLTHAIPFGLPAEGRINRRHPANPAAASLLTRCIDNGLTQSSTTASPFSEFVTGACFHLPLLMKWQIYISRSRAARTWDFCSGPLSDWMSQYGDSPIVVPRPHFVEPQIPAAAVRCLVASRVLKHEDFELLGFDMQRVCTP
jgi:hypothetical protein